VISSAWASAASASRVKSRPIVAASSITARSGAGSWSSRAPSTAWYRGRDLIGRPGLSEDVQQQLGEQRVAVAQSGDPLADLLLLLRVYVAGHGQLGAPARALCS